jgi:hypothetical protein
MTTRQFYFSGLSGGFLMAAGAGLVAGGAPGGGLVVVGLIITTLAVTFRFQGLRLPLPRLLTANAVDASPVLPEPGN